MPTLDEKITGLLSDIDSINARMKALKEENQQKCSELDKAYYQKAVENYPFPVGTKVRVTVRSVFGGRNIAYTAYLGEPKATGFAKPYKSYFYDTNPNGTKSPRGHFMLNACHPSDIVRIEKADET